MLQIVEDLRKLSACWGRGIAGKDDGEMCIESEGMSSHVFVQIGSYRKVGLLQTVACCLVGTHRCSLALNIQYSTLNAATVPIFVTGKRLDGITRY